MGPEAVIDLDDRCPDSVLEAGSRRFGIAFLACAIGCVTLNPSAGLVIAPILSNDLVVTLFPNCLCNGFEGLLLL
jgi:hypothetical protein